MHKENLLMNPQARIHMLLPHQDHDSTKVFDFCCLALELGLTLASEHGLPHEAIPVFRLELVVKKLDVSPYGWLHFLVDGRPSVSQQIAHRENSSPDSEIAH